MTTNIYKIFCEDDISQCYVGRTKSQIEVRLYQHYADRNKLITCGIGKLMRLLPREKFKISLLEVCDSSIAREREQHWINQCGNLNIQNAVKDKDYDKKYAKQYRINHPRDPVYHNQQEKKFYQTHKAQILEKRRERVLCDCGMETQKGHLERHRKTKLHQHIINQTASLSVQDSS